MPEKRCQSRDMMILEEQRAPCSGTTQHALVPKRNVAHGSLYGTALNELDNSGNISRLYLLCKPQYGSSPELYADELTEKHV